jgi:hypothetical protein
MESHLSFLFFRPQKRAWLRQHFSPGLKAGAFFLRRFRGLKAPAPSVSLAFADSGAPSLWDFGDSFECVPRFHAEARG